MKDMIISATIEREGGYVNDKNDPGMETKYGISKRQYPDVDIKNLTVEQAAAIYARDYWTKWMEGWDSGRYFDLCVNLGTFQATKLVQRAAGVEDDGIFGPVTLAACIHTNQGQLNKLLQREAAMFYTGLNKSRFIQGWLNRLFD